jgi:hypothetical protein
VIRPIVRFRAALLGALFIIGALGTPVADGLLFHRAGSDPYAWVTHLEPLGSTHHAERCALQAPAMAQREGLGSSRAIRVAPPLVVRSTPAIAAAPAAAELIALRHSRAPPA